MHSLSVLYGTASGSVVKNALASMNGYAPGFSAIRKQSRRLAYDRAGIGKPLVQAQVVGRDVERCQPYENNHLREASGLLQRRCR
jgi:hypothetical protein